MYIYIYIYVYTYNTYIYVYMHVHLLDREAKVEGFDGEVRAERAAAQHVGVADRLALYNIVYYTII